MPALSVRNLTMTFIERNLFTDVSFDIENNDKVGFIGANGVGKTTLFKILNGEISPTSGTVTFEKNTRVGYMEQHACNNPRIDVYSELLSVFDYLADMEKEISAVTNDIDNKNGDLNKLVERQTLLIESFENLGGLTYKSRTRSALLGLGFKESDFTMPVGSLSGGQRSKLCLAKLLLSQSNMLLLDEPTNHLDIGSVNWLEGFLRDFKGAMIIISHDRYFLDRVTNKTIELEHNRTMCYKGAYSEFIEKKKAYNESLKNKYENDIKEIKRIEGIVEQQKRWGREHNFITAASKQKEADRIKAQLVTPDSELETMHMRFEPKCESGNDVLICRGLAKSFGEKHLFKNVDIHIRKGERVFILGSNGCGKTTLFKILTGKYPQDSGEYDYGANVQVGYFDQMQQNLDLSKTAIDEVWDAFPNMTQTEVRSAMASFLFKGEEVFKPLSKMSGGERARISLLKLMLKGGNFLLLDEPTNHLDSSSREELENTLKEYGGTLLIISHDRYFINKLADRVLVMTPDGVTEYLGNYDYYLERTKSEIGEAKAEKADVNKEKPQNDYFLQKQRQSEERKRKTRLSKAEAEIERLDEEIEKTQALLSSEEVAADYEKLIELTSKLEQLQQEQEEQYLIWEELSE
ncbi:ABC-F family ATP-binding cassette domain-containing protein [uncultured Ruminococcus sp.]|uniref:ABC-F family ATP-binding cassette domain-containing protein n=1 Tax=uncultured Ruminococcus sp. TaxID=165186 RepID=UPI0025E2A058|nr:ABC-F family ATP-binding cassette domain-containing protein [uncultured Ruminococcus sp.]